MLAGTTLRTCAGEGPLALQGGTCWAEQGLEKTCQRYQRLLQESVPSQSVVSPLLHHSLGLGNLPGISLCFRTLLSAQPAR